jgi:hypothetical protein
MPQDIKPPLVRKKTIWIDSRQQVPGREFEDQITMCENGRIGRRNESSAGFLSEFANGLFDVG